MGAPPLILLVEDDASNQILFQAILDRAGYEVLIAGTAAEAREHLKSRSPVLILMDVRLTGEDGLSLTRWLKFMHETEAIPVVALTASGRLRDREAAFSAGCVGFISKPVDVHTFAARVAQFLQGPPAQSTP